MSLEIEKWLRFSLWCNVHGNSSDKVALGGCLNAIGSRCFSLEKTNGFAKNIERNIPARRELCKFISKQLILKSLRELNPTRWFTVLLDHDTMLRCNLNARLQCAVVQINYWRNWFFLLEEITCLETSLRLSTVSRFGMNSGWTCLNRNYSSSSKSQWLWSIKIQAMQNYYHNSVCLLLELFFISFIGLTESLGAVIYQIDLYRKKNTER